MLKKRYVRGRLLAVFVALLVAVAAGVVAMAGTADTSRSAQAEHQGQSPYAAVARGRVAVKGGMISLHVPVAGTVDTVKAQAGDDVHKGQLLAQLDPQVAQARLDIAGAKLTQARTQSDILADRLKAARSNAGKLRSAARAGAGSAHDADAAAQQVRELKWQLKGDRAQVQIAQGQVAIARHQLAQHRITAPAAGRIVTVHIQAGDQLSAASKPAFELLPDRQRVIRAELNQEYVEAVRPGMQAQVVLDNGNQKILGTAHVVRVGDVFHQPSLENNPALNAGTRTVLCVLRFDKPTHLRIGQLVLVRVLRQSSPSTSATPSAKGS
ncbi:MAG: HlyD family efflux transporter periplasmic adaptor subunit [Salinisphaera sp.]|jgi:multidrug resistance efflux pump|nr:HlyD family efflux transporter periplasmic adaptor subunit [Salinisphaera sp.]